MTLLPAWVVSSPRAEDGSPGLCRFRYVVDFAGKLRECGDKECVQSHLKAAHDCQSNRDLLLTVSGLLGDRAIAQEQRDKASRGCSLL